MIENHINTIEAKVNDLVGQVRLDFSVAFNQHAINRCDLEVGMCYHSEGTIQGPRTNDFHTIWFVLEGELDCETDKSKLNLKKGDWSVCPANVTRTLTSENGFYWFWFKCIKPERWNIQGSEPYKTQPETTDALQNLIDLIRHEMKIDLNSKVMGNLLEIMPILISREFSYRPVLEDSHLKRLEEVWSMIRLSPAEDWGVEKCSALLHVSKGYFHHLCKKYYECRPMDKVTEIRIQCAEEALLGNQKSIEAIAHEIGYGSATALSNAFYRIKGIRPSDFRHQAVKLTL